MTFKSPDIKNGKISNKQKKILDQERELIKIIRKSLIDLSKKNKEKKEEIDFLLKRL